MIFVHPLLLLFLAAPVVAVALAWRSTPRRILLISKAAAIAAVIAALAEPVISYSNPRVAVAVLADTSRSLTTDDLTSRELNTA